MLTGTQLLVPDGLGQLARGVSYHFLTNDPRTARVILVHFHWEGKGHPPGACLIPIHRDEFEEALSKGLIVISPSQSNLPPWLESLKDKNLAALDSKRVKPKQLHSQRIESRLLFITPALENLHEILTADSIEAEINAYARRATPPQNETRFRVWFLTYLCFGRNVWSLLPPYCLAGNWSRDNHASRKQGAPSKAFGKNYGFRMTKEMAERCVKAYVKFMAPGRSMSDIYASAMVKEFGCMSIARSSGLLTYRNPEGEAFPSERQFRYHVGKLLGVENIQKNRYGSARHRRRLAPPQGRFSADVSNLMEKIEADGYYTSEKPKGYLEGSILPSLCVIVARDMLSGEKLGIGFSFGKETGTAYRMMMFSMAVPKEYFCRLWGVNLQPGEWPCQGISPHFKMDRGPGSSLALIQDENAKPVIRNMTQSWSGQAKATVESSHPRDVQFEGEPSYFASQLTPVELARREIYTLIKYNHTADMSSRMEIDRNLAYVAPTPHALWNHYAARFRSSAVPMSIEDAVRAFLTPVTLTAKKDGVYLDGRRFNSGELRESGLLDRIARGNLGTVTLHGYLMDLCLRHVWVEVDRQILLLDAQLAIREDEELLFISVAELEQWREARARINSEFAVHKSAAKAEYMTRFENDIGLSWDAGNRKSGKVKRSATARQEEIEARQHTSQRKSAG